MNRNAQDSIGEVIKKQRIAMALTLQELAAKSGVSASHLGRIERSERFPSAHILRKIAQPLGLGEDDLFIMAGYLSPQTPSIAEKGAGYTGERLDPYVARVLSQEPVEVQRALVSILTILKNLAKGMSKDNG